MPPLGSPTAASPAQTVPTTFINTANGYPTTVISPPPNQPTPVQDDNIHSHQYGQVHDVSSILNNFICREIESLVRGENWGLFVTKSVSRSQPKT